MDTFNNNKINAVSRRYSDSVGGTTIGAEIGRQLPESL
jgi:hypothetical protein